MILILFKNRKSKRGNNLNNYCSQSETSIFLLLFLPFSSKPPHSKTMLILLSLAQFSMTFTPNITNSPPRKTGKKLNVVLAELKLRCPTENYEDSI